MSGKAARVFLTETMYEILSDLSKRRMLASSILVRVQIVLLAFEKLKNIEIAEVLDVGRHCVGLWRKRWRDSYEALQAIQMTESRAKLERVIIDVLRDSPRCGSPGKFTAAQVVQIIATACEPPRSTGRPVESWTGRELVDEVRKRGIVEYISVSRVNHYLRVVELQPHRHKYWCFTTEKDHELFRLQVETVCKTYLNAADVRDRDNVKTVCIDEMTSLGANERRADKSHPRPGQVAKIECQYNRHGTLSLTGSWDVVAGQMIHTTINETRNAEDFAQHVKSTIQTDPTAGWIFVVDNLNTHYGEPIVRTVADLLGIDPTTLGKKKKCGILKSMISRRKFLSDPDHPIRFVYLPKHSSWLNQIEVIFGIVAKRVIRGGSFKSKSDLKDKLLTFIDYFNQTFATPINWTYTGRTLQQTKQKRPNTWRELRHFTKTEQILALVA